MTRGTRWTGAVPADWIELGHQARAKHGMMRINLHLEAEKFADYWSATGKTKLDWLATWRNWCRNARGGQPEAQPVKAKSIDKPALTRVSLALKGTRVVNFSLRDVAYALDAKAITPEEARKLGYREPSLML